MLMEDDQRYESLFPAIWRTTESLRIFSLEKRWFSRGILQASKIMKSIKGLNKNLFFIVSSTTKRIADLLVRASWSKVRNKPEEMVIHERAADMWKPLSMNVMKTKAFRGNWRSSWKRNPLLCSAESWIF